MRPNFCLSGRPRARRYAQVLMRLTEQLHPLFTHFIALAQGRFLLRFL